MTQRPGSEVEIVELSWRVNVSAHEGLDSNR